MADVITYRLDNTAKTFVELVEMLVALGLYGFVNPKFLDHGFVGKLCAVGIKDRRPSVVVETRCILVPGEKAQDKDGRVRRAGVEKISDHEGRDPNLVEALLPPAMDNRISRNRRPYVAFLQYTPYALFVCGDNLSRELHLCSRKVWLPPVDFLRVCP